MSTLPKKNVDASRFQTPLENLANVMIERVGDEWPSSLGHLPFAQSFFRYTLRYCRVVFRVECGMFSDERRDDYRWTWEGVVLLPSANRTLLDCLFNAVFMLDDIETRAIWFHKSGWREQKLEYDRWKREYGADAEWRKWLDGLASLIDRGVVQFSITKEELEDPGHNIQAWPSSGQMPDYKVDTRNRPPAREFLHFLSDLHYRSYSGQSHMSFLGMMKLGGIIGADDLPPEDRDRMRTEGLPLLMSEHLSLSATLLLCVISELQSHFRFSGDIELRILALWHILIPDFPDAKEIFERRYSSLFPAFMIGG